MPFRPTLEHLPISFAVIWGDVTLDDVFAMERYYMSIYERGQRFGSIVDARRATVPPSPVRREMAEMSNRMEPYSKKLSIATSTILTSKVLVGALTAVRWFIKADITLVYHASAVEALDWLTARMADERLAPPLSARAFASKLDSARSADAAGALFPPVS